MDSGMKKFFWISTIVLWIFIIATVAFDVTAHIGAILNYQQNLKFPFPDAVTAIVNLPVKLLENTRMRFFPDNLMILLPWTFCLACIPPGLILIMVKFLSPTKQKGEELSDKCPGDEYLAAKHEQHNDGQPAAGDSRLEDKAKTGRDAEGVGHSSPGQRPGLKQR